MTDNIDELITALTEMVLVLDEVKETFWSKWLRSDMEIIRQGNFHGIEHLLTAFGGMGSFNDLIIHPRNGHDIEEKDVAKVNERFEGLKRRIYHLARNIKREVEDE